LFQGEVHALVHTSTRYEPGAYGWERAQDFSALVERNLISVDEHDRMRLGLEQLAAMNQFFYSITMYVYSGSKA
jgi:hypothetical protein